jgi:hypothetical protein
VSAGSDPNVFQVDFGYHQYVSRRLGVDIAYYQGIFGLADDRGWDFAGHDAAEEATHTNWG